MKQVVLGYFCGSKSWGGLEMNQLKNAREMKAKGYDVVVVSPENSPLLIQAEASGMRCVGVNEHAKYYDVVNARKLSHIITAHNITHLIIRNPKDMSLAALTKTLLRGKIHLSYFMEMQLGISKKDPLHTLRFRQFDVWSCPLEFLKQQVIEFTRFPQNRIVVIPSGLNMNQFYQLPDTEASRASLELPQNGKIIGLMGRFDAQKGQLMLLEAFYQLVRSNDFKFPIYLLLMGDKTAGEAEGYVLKIQQFIEANGLSEFVFLRPFQKEVSTFYAAIDVFVMASANETFGMVTIEAMASGLPIVGSNSGGTIEILKKGELGLLFESGNKNDLAEKLQRAIELPFVRVDLLQEESKKYEFNRVTSQVEKALGL